MRALTLVKHGAPEEALQVRDWPDPVPGAGEVLIDVRAAGINFADIVARMGLYPDAPKTPCVMGYEVAGLVESVGSGVDGFELGQRVLAGTRFKGFAEKVATAAGNVMPLPERMSFEQGAALPVNYATAYAAITLMTNVREGETVLVHAAAGGVGIALLQLLRPRGAQVIGTASASKHDAIREQGAAHAIDYRTQDVKREVDRITGGRGVDVVLDALGEFRQSYSLLRAGGRLVAYGASKVATGERRNLARVAKEIVTMPRFMPLRMMSESKAVLGLNMLRWWDERGSLEEFTKPLMELAEQGTIDPVVAKAFPLERAPEAHRFIQERRNIGKVVLTLGAD
jgi:NADPH:quinone reductase-like Zn-dependent oxidoreductase